MRQVLYAILILITLGCRVDNEQKTGYIFPSFTGNGEDGLHLLVSYDGFSWATNIEHRDVFPETWNPEIWKNMNHRIYYIVTKDIISYSPRRLFYAPKNHMVIDAFVAKVDDENYMMGIKEEWLVYCDYWRTKSNGWIRNAKIFEVAESEVDRLSTYKTDGLGMVEPIPQATWR